MSTPYHSLYWATLLTLRGPGGSIERLSRGLSTARVDLNPHQVDAALFAIRSPLSKGVILADEVGLGKTIEASLVIAQRWAERRRRVLLILPATLRKQWQQELLDKFGLPSEILETPAFRQRGLINAFDQPGKVLICSYQLAASKAFELRNVTWDLIVIDEAHRLRNVYKKSSKIAATIRDATLAAPKILLTATPLQNSLMELYGLISVIDPQVFGDDRSFKDQFSDAALNPTSLDSLKQRLAPLCTRTLRKQVLEYVRFTERRCITRDFYPPTTSNPSTSKSPIIYSALPSSPFPTPSASSSLSSSASSSRHLPSPSPLPSAAWPTVLKPNSSNPNPASPSPRMPCPMTTTNPRPKRAKSGLTMNPIPTINPNR